jgi:Uma2 family endonuclease
MSSGPEAHFSPEEYLARERLATFKSEYLRGKVVAMSRANYAHTLVKDNLAGEAGNQLENTPCRVLTSDMRVKVEATGLYTYPDIAIVCDEPRFEDEVFDTLLNPRALVEVLSDSTEKYDRCAKFGHYRQIPSLQEYVLVAQDQPLVERYVRQPDGSWLLTVFEGLDQTFAFASVPARIRLADIYGGIAFPEKASPK